jgi:predicted nucleic acid-binding protein
VIVVDASTLTAFMLKEENWRALAEYLKYALSVDHIAKEVANTIWKAYQVKKVIGASKAMQLFNILRSLLGVNILLEPEQRYLCKAFELAIDYDITVYDALYVALADGKKLPLLTLDDRQKHVAKAIGIKIIEM